MTVFAEMTADAPMRSPNSPFPRPSPQIPDAANPGFETKGEPVLAKPRRRPWAQLINAVLDLAGPRAEFVAHAERAWASVTFSGSRHTITLAFNGDAAMVDGEAFAEALGEHEFALSGQIVADASVIGMLHEAAHAGKPEARMTIEAELLLVEDL